MRVHDFIRAKVATKPSLFLLLPALFLAGLFITNNSLMAQGLAQPNVIVILADDLSARSYALYGAETSGDWGVVSPVVETMAEQGLYFDTAWCIPRCTPTRALLHTGKYPFRTRVFGQQIYPRGGNGLIKPIDQRFPNTMGTLMAANGYRTAMIGKIATGDVQGLGYQNWCIVNQGRIFDMTFSDHDIDGTRVVDPDTHSTDTNFDYLHDFTAVQGESPWFVYMSLNLPHEVYDGSSYSPPPVPELDGNWELTGNLVSNDFPATLRYIDYKLGGFIDHLEATGQLMNTVIIYCGDNGVGRYGKSNPDSEKGPRVPFVVYAPGLLAPTGVSDELIDFSDIVPTVVELAGGTLPTDDVFDGHSFAPLILGGPFEGREWIFSQWRGCRWLRTDRWLLDGRGTFYDCGTHRNEWEGTYLDVTESMDSEVVAARKQVGRVLDELPLPDFYDPELANDWQNEWLNHGSFLEPYVPPYLGGVAEGSFENPANVVGTWGMFPAVWNDTWTSQYEVGAPGHLSRSADGEWAALLSETGTIVQDLGLAVNEGETLKVTFHGGRAEEGKNTAGGGVIECTFIVDSVRYSMTADTTLLPEDTWQLYTHEVTATNSGDLTLEFACTSGTPWLDAISDITVTVASAQPNVVVVYIDDMGWKDLSCYGSTFYETPVIDQLAVDGTRFTDAYAACQICSPSRRALLTGKYPSQSNFTDLPGRPAAEGKKLIDPVQDDIMPNSEVLFPEIFQAAGYHTGFIGKWHLEVADEGEMDTEHGFDVWDEINSEGAGNMVLVDDAQDPKEVSEITDKSIAFVQDAVTNQQPFMLYMSHRTVHVQLQTTPELHAKYDAKGPGENGQDNPYMGGMVEDLDSELGRFLQTLETLGVADDTIVVFTSDNGGVEQLTGTQVTSQAPLRGGKGTEYDGGVRVPMIFKGPGIQSGSVVSTPTIQTDLYPTLVELAGLNESQGHVHDGVSLATLLQEGTGSPELDAREAIFWDYPDYKARMAPASYVRKGDWALILYNEQEVSPYGGKPNELYNLSTDISQATNLITQFPVKAAELYDDIVAHRQATAAQMPTADPAYVWAGPPTTITLPGRFEAEDYDYGGEGAGYHDVDADSGTDVYRTDAVDIEPALDDGAGFCITSASAGEWLDYHVNVESSAPYDIHLRVATGLNDRQVLLSLDGTPLATVDIPATGGDQIWTTVIADDVALTAGNHLLRVESGAQGGPNLNWIDVQSAGNVIPVGPHHLEWGVPSGSVQQLSWVAGAGALSYDVHFGTSAAAVSGSAAFQGNQSGATFDTPVLAADTIYYWRVDVVTSTGTIAGPVWSFRTDNRARYDVSDTVLENNFANPPNEFRIVKYQLNNSHLAEYPQYGFGGYQGFFYNNLYKNAAGGVDGIGPLVDAANAQGRTVWSADDNGYPSGSAGGLVVTNNPEYEVRGVAMLSTAGSGQVPVSISTPADCEKMVSAVLYPVAGGVPDYSQGQVQSVQESGVSTTGLAGDWKLCAFVLQIRDSNTQAQNKAEQFGSTGHYPDLLNSNAVASWISLMHEPIVAEITDLASKFEGFYFNEPSLMQLNWETTAPYACLSWNAGLTSKFQTMHGYDLEQVMAALYGGNDLSARRVRMHYHQTVAEMMRTSFTGQIAEWCGQRGIVTSGHPLLEESLHMQVANFGDMMKVFGEVQVPAVDLAMPEPGDMATENYHFPKQMSSMGAWNEYDRRVVGLLDPVIGGNGGRTTPSEDVIHNIVNHSAASGVNSFSTYIRAHDPAYGGTEVFERVNEYAGRISSVLTGARVASDVALYYPINMFQMEYKPITGTHWNTWNPQRQKNWDDLQEDMLSADVNYNIVHPDWVRDAVIEGGELKIGSGSYRYLVMPDVEIISSNVLARIQQFEAAGGTVLWVDSKPSAGAYSSEDAQVNAAVAGYSTVSPAQVPGLISDPYGEGFKLQVASSQVLTTRFDRSGRSLYYLVNPTGSPLTAQLDYGVGSGTLKICDPVSGNIIEAVQSAEVVIDGYRSALVFSDPHPSSSVTDGSFENPPGTHSTWRTCHAGWNPTVTSPYQILNPNGTHFDAAVDGDWCAYLTNLGTISQELDMMVEAGDTLSVAFYAGRSKDSSGSAGGGVFTCTLRVGATPYSMTVDTTLQDENSWQKYTHNVTITNSGPLALEFSRASGKPWIDHISDVVVDLVTAPTGLTVSPGIGGISLDWDDHPDGDFESYTVYRSTSSGGGYVQIASGLVDSEFTDTTAVPDANSYYVVVAIDAEGNRSLFSTEVSGGLPQPNVIMILIDDMGWADSSTYGSTYYQTPNLTRLAEEGMLFTDAYAASPLCSPTRASIMSGQHPARLRMTVAITGSEVAEPQALEPAANKYLGLVESRNHLPLEVNTLAETMKTSGYHTAHIGKWHLTPSTGGAAFNADHQGFDYVIGGDHRAGPPDYYSPYNIRNLTDGPDGEYLNERLAEECIQWIGSVKDSSQPFYLNFWHYAVHGPIIPKEDLMPKYEALRDPNNPQRCPEMATMLESMDNSIGLLLDWLDLPENSELKANTMIVLTSDNGGVTHNETGNGDTWTSNRPLRGGKANTYEGGIRVPWIVRWPGRVGAGTTNATPVQTIDIYPTVLEAAGIAQPAGTVLDGQSIVPLLNGTSSEHQPVFTDFPHIFGILCAPSACVRDGDWKLIRYYHAGEDAASHAYELFDLSRDPAEAVNLAAYFPDKVAELDLLIDTHLIDTDALVPIASTNYSGSAIDVPRGSAAAAPNRPVSLRLPETEIRTLAAGSRTIRLLDQDDQPRTTHALVLEGDEWVSVENQPDGSVLVQWDAQPSYKSARLLFGWKGGETTREMNDWTFGPYELLIGIDSESEGLKNGFSQSVLMGHSYFQPGTDDIKVLASYYGYTRHTQFAQLAGGTNGDPGSLWRDTGEDEGAKAEIKKGTTEVLGLTLFSTLDGDSDYEDYKQWIDFTLQYNPDTFDTFFIMIPWASYANNPTYAEHRASQDTVNEYVYDIIQQLRVEYPQLSCLAMPVGEAMSRLWRLYDEGQLGPEILGVKLNGNRDNYLQYDNIGHAGKIMEDTLGLIWQKTLYPETDIRTVADPPTFQHDWTYDIRQLAYEIWRDDPYAHRPPPFIPDIMVEQPVNTSLADGAATTDFGSVVGGSNSQRTFTIRNSGTGTLSGLAATIDGTHQAEFTTGALSATALQPGETATFTVTFTPAAEGLRTAALHVARNDADENPFDVGLSGTGTVPPFIPDSPTNVTATDGFYQGKVRISWNASNGATDYEIYRGTLEDGSDTVLVGSTGATEFIDGTGNAGEDYYYFVKANAGAETSDLSDGEMGHGTIEPPFQPDGLIGKKSASLKGNNIYNTGSGQTITLTSKNLKTLKWYFEIQNDGETADQLACRLTRKNNYFKAKLKTATGANVTAAAYAGILRGGLAGGETERYKLEVKPTRKAKDKAKKRTFKFSTISGGDGSKQDILQALAKTKK